jgi:uncharacterized protein YkwD
MRRLTGATLVALFVFLAVGAVPAAAFDRSASEATLLSLVNHARVKRGLSRVKIASTLDRAALSHSRDMLRRGYFSHSSLGGVSVARRTRGAGYSLSGCSYWSVGEVIAWGKSSRGTPQAVFHSWMHSSAHRRVILSKRWRDVGIGCDRGTYRGLSDVIMYTVDFGRRVR